MSYGHILESCFPHTLIHSAQAWCMGPITKASQLSAPPLRSEYYFMAYLLSWYPNCKV